MADATDSKSVVPLKDVWVQVPPPAFLAFLLRVVRGSYTYRAWLWLRHTWQERFTAPGRYAVMACGGFLIAGSFPNIMLGDKACALFAAIIMLAIALSGASRLKLQVRRQVPKRCVAGATIPLHIQVENVAGPPVTEVGAYEFRLPAGVKINEPVCYSPLLAPGETWRHTYTVTVGSRGTYDLPGPTVLSAFPFGLTNARRFAADVQRLVVYPAFHPLASLTIPVAPRYQPGGIVLTSNVGESMEFIGNREYRMGDRQRDVHPRSWARVGYPVVRQFQEEFLARVAILVDTYVPPEALPRRRRRWWGDVELWPSRAAVRVRQDLLECNLSLAAAIADHLARQEYVVDLFAAGPELYYLQAGRSLAYFENILDILACIERCPDDPLQAITPKFSQELSQISSVILLLLNWDASRQALIQKVRQAGASAKIVVVSDHLTEADLPGAGADVRCLTRAQVRQGVASL